MVNKPTNRQKEVLKKYGYMPPTEKQEKAIGTIQRRHGIRATKRTVSEKTGVVSLWIKNMTYRIAPSGVVIRSYKRKK